MVWQPYILNNCYELSGGYSPEPPTRGSAPGPRWGTSVSQTPCAPPPLNPGCATAVLSSTCGYFFYRAMLCMHGSSRGPVSVCPSQVGVLLKWLDGSSWFVAWRLLSTSPTLCFKEIQVGLSAKITALLSGTFSKLRTWKISPRHIDRTCYQLSSRKVTTLRTR